MQKLLMRVRCYSVLNSQIKKCGDSEAEGDMTFLLNLKLIIRLPKPNLCK